MGAGNARPKPFTFHSQPFINLSFSDLDYIVNHWSKKVKIKFNNSQIIQNYIYYSNIEL